MATANRPAVEPGPLHATTRLARLTSIHVERSGSPEHPDEFTIRGHAAVFDEWSEPLTSFAGQFRERIAPGAFSDVLERRPDVRLLVNHDENLVLARSSSGTLELSEDDTGLSVFARVAATTYASDLRVLMARKDVDQMSFAFDVAEDTWTEDKDAEEITRTISRVGALYDVSVVTFPAYPQTDAQVMRTLTTAISEGKIHSRTVIPFRATPKADVNAVWNGPAEVARADAEDLRAMSTWFDPADTDANGDLNKSAFKLPHHRADASHPVVWRGVNTAMQRLMGTSIPQSDKRGCHGHLAGHYRQFDKEPPAFEDLARAYEAGDERRLADLCGTEESIASSTGSESVAETGALGVASAAGGVSVARFRARARRAMLELDKEDKER